MAVCQITSHLAVVSLKNGCVLNQRAPSSANSLAFKSNRADFLGSSLKPTTICIAGNKEHTRRSLTVNAGVYDPFAAVEEDEWEEEDPEVVKADYERLYGKFELDSGSKGSNASANDDEDDDSTAKGRGRRGRKSDENDDDSRGPARRQKDEFEERLIQVRRVTKVVKGGKQLSFRTVVVVGDRKGRVGVGVAKAKEVIIAVQKAGVDARRHLVKVPMTKYLTFPHRADGTFGAAHVMLRPASLGTGVIAGGAVRVVLELAGVENALGKELGSGNPLNNARAVLDAVSNMKQFREVAEERGIPMEELWK